MLEKNIGLDIEVSYAAIMNSVEKFENDFEKIIVCFDNDTYINFLKNKKLVPYH